MLHGHGFGGSRSLSGFDDYLEAGFTVISIDQRGFGESTGTVRVMAVAWSKTGLGSAVSTMTVRDEAPADLIMPRFLAQPPLLPTAPFDLAGADGERLPVVRAIRMALDGRLG